MWIRDRPFARRLLKGPGLCSTNSKRPLRLLYQAGISILIDEGRKSIPSHDQISVASSQFYRRCQNKNINPKRSPALMKTQGINYSKPANQEGRKKTAIKPQESINTAH